MAKRIVLWVVVAAALIWGGSWAYKQYTANQRMRDGDVLSGDPRDGDSGPVVAAKTPASDTANTTGATSQPPTAGEVAKTQNSPLAAVASAARSVTSSLASAIPGSDSEAPNAPDGMKFSGSGKFQVYRQGNLTWRVNTETGSTCILFATNEEWRKPIVYNHGCGNS